MLKEAIHTCIEANIPVVLKGDPGIGKTSYIQALARKAQANLYTVIASTHAPEDFLGLPLPTKDEDVIWAPPRWGKTLTAWVEAGIPAWLFLDEISCAAPAVQAATLRLVHERVLGELELPQAVRMVLAMNPPETAAGGWDLTPAMANRMFHHDWVVNVQEWATGIISGFTMDEVKNLPENWEMALSNNKTLIATYIRAIGGEALIKVPRDDSQAGGPWPSPRTWDMAGRLLTAGEMLHGDKGGELQMALLQGSVGEGQAIQFMEWVNNMDLPNPVDLLNNPGDYEIPDRADKVAAVLSSVVSTITAQPSEPWYLAGWKILGKTAEESYPDIAASMAMSLAVIGKNNPNYPDIGNQAAMFMPILQAAGLIRTRPTD